VDQTGATIAFLGTGFVPVASEPVFVTAGHVIRDNPLAEGERYYVYFQSDDGTDISAAGSGQNAFLSDRYDLAALPIEDLAGVRPLYLDPSEIPMNELVVCREYSGNHLERNPVTGKVTARLRPRNHVGNVMCYFMSTFPETRPTPCVELSFPALQGASGAPVVRDQSRHAIAVLVANVESELMPAQVLRVDGHDGEPTEEVRYFLPVGKGLRATAVIEFLQDECGITCAEAPPMYLPGEII